MDFKGLIFVFAGLFSMAAVIFEWEWFMNHHKTQFLIRIAGRTGAKIFYGLLGAFLTAIGFAATFGLVDFSR